MSNDNTSDGANSNNKPIQPAPTQDTQPNQDKISVKVISPAEYIKLDQADSKPKEK